MKTGTPLQRIAELLFALRAEPELDTRIEALAQRAGFSPFHFQRLFRVATGETIGEYIRTRRLERAARTLLSSEKSVTEIASESGYETPSAFTRAFAGTYGTPPLRYRERGEAIMNQVQSFDIVERPAMRLLGVRKLGSYVDAESAWKQLVERGLARGIYDKASQRVGLSWDDPEHVDASELRYAACFVADASADELLEEIFVDAGRWAVTEHRGPYELIGHSFDQLMRSVVLASSRELRDAPAVEFYRNNPRQVAPADLRTELWLPIV